MPPDITSAESYYSKTNEGLVCESCVIFMTAIEDALLDPNIEDMVYLAQCFKSFQFCPKNQIQSQSRLTLLVTDRVLPETQVLGTRSVTIINTS